MVGKRRRIRRYTVSEAAQDYIDRGFSVVPLNERSKSTNVHWGDTEFAAEDFLPSNNIAVRTGGASRIVDVDLDHDLCLEFLSFLPPTGLSFGRESRPTSHLIYRVPNLEEFRIERFDTTDNEIIVEIRGNGHLTMFPPSQHPSDGYLHYVGNGNPSEVAIDDLRDSVSIMAAGVITALAWPSQGSRHSCAMALGAVLLRHRGREFADSFLGAVARAAGDEEVSDRVRTVQDSLDQLESDGPTTGIPRLVEYLGQDATTRTLQLLGIESPTTNPEPLSRDAASVLREMNQQYAAVLIGGQQKVVRLEHLSQDPLTSQGFRDLLRGQHFTDGVRNVALADFWLSQPDRNLYHGVQFAPDGGRPDYFNYFLGFSVEPHPGDASRYWDFVLEVIADGDHEIYQYLRRWLGFCFQFPERLPGTALIVRGRQGVGKSFFVKPIARLMGPYAFEISRANQLVGRFFRIYRPVLAYTY